MRTCLELFREQMLRPSSPGGPKHAQPEVFGRACPLESNKERAGARPPGGMQGDTPGQGHHGSLLKASARATSAHGGCHEGDTALLAEGGIGPAGLPPIHFSLCSLPSVTLLPMGMLVIIAPHM